MCGIHRTPHRTAVTATRIPGKGTNGIHQSRACPKRSYRAFSRLESPWLAHPRYRRGSCTEEHGRPEIPSSQTPHEFAGVAVTLRGVGSHCETKSRESVLETLPVSLDGTRVAVHGVARFA